MPEACDIAVIVDYLTSHFVGRKITSTRHSKDWDVIVSILDYNLISVSSHGKVIKFEWKNGRKEKWMTIHLMLHGRLYDDGYCQDNGHYFTLGFEEDNNSHIHLSMYDHMGIATCSLSDEEPFEEGSCVMSGDVRLDELSPVLTRSNIYNSLLKQESVRGIGTQLATEILHSARIHPGRKGNSLNNAEIDRLLAAINTIPSLVKKCGGFHHSRPVSPDGCNGYYVPCYVEKTSMKKVKISSKVTYTEIDDS